MVLSYCFTSLHQILMLLADTSRNFFEILSITVTTAVQSHSTFLGTFLRFTTWLLAPPSALFRYLFVEMRIFIQAVLDAESFKSAYSIIFETKFLPYASCVLISSSILCMFFVLRNVSIPYPPNIAEEKGSKRTENIEVYKFPPVSGVSKSSLLTSRADRSVREDLKKFVTVKAKEFNSPSSSYGLNDGRADGNHRLNGNSPASSYGGDYYIESEEHSLISDDENSEISRADHRIYDHTTDMTIKDSAKNPSLLIGWQINAKGRGVGLILDMKKSLGRTTKFKVQFENGNIKLLSLKRSDRKGNVPFSLIMKVNN